MPDHRVLKSFSAPASHDNGIRNFSEDGPSHSGTQAFITALWDEIKLGYGFIPYVGAGFSVAAGIPVVWQFHEYLKRCIAAAIGVNLIRKAHGCTHLNLERNLFNPRTDRWPPLITGKHCENGWTEVVKKKYEVLRKTSSTSPSFDDWELRRITAIYQEALGAMAEWRSALVFLSRIDHDRHLSSGERNTLKTLVLSQPNQEVVDACLRHALSARSPALNHIMLATLSQILRIDRVLTTNFDDLLEKAFTESRNHFNVFDVHLDDRLPDIHAIVRTRSIIKIHGSRNSLRADFSLDSPPSADDIRTFISYIAGTRVSEDGKAHPVERNHLLLFGVGLSERRTQEYLLHSLKRLPDLKVFIVCFQQSDVDAAIRTYKILNLVKGPKTPTTPRILVLRHGNSGLFLLHLYQWLRKALPVSGATFPNASRLAIPRLPSTGSIAKSVRGHARKDNKAIDALRRVFKDRNRSVVPSKTENALWLLASPTTVQGVGELGANLCECAEPNFLCIWIELHDIADPVELFEVFKEAVYRKLGETDWTPLYVDDYRAGSGGKEAASQDYATIWSRELERIVNASPKPIALFLDARELPGSNREKTEESHLNGWLDEIESIKGKRKPRGSIFVKLLKVLCGSGNSKQHVSGNSYAIRTVLLLFNSQKEDSGTESKCYQTLNSEDYRKSLRCVPVELARKANVPPFNLDEAVYMILNWTTNVEDDDERSARQHLVQLLVSMQRTRHLSVAWSRWSNPSFGLCSRFDSDKEAWLSELEGLDLVMRKEGGFIWVNARLRQRLRTFLGLSASDLNSDNRTREWSCSNPAHARDILRAWRSWDRHKLIHYSLTCWYQSLFESSGTSRALLEAINHLMFSVSAGIRAVDRENNDAVKRELNEAADRINGARNLLQSQMFRIQTEGLPTGSRRRLEYIRAYWFRKSQDDRSITSVIRKCINTHKKDAEDVLKAIAKLQCACVEVIRSIDRELGEINRAYQQHKSFGIRTIADMPLPEFRDEASESDPKRSAVSSVQAMLEKYEKARHGSRAVKTSRNSLSERIRGSLAREPKKLARQKHWIRWWRWSGMLALASHSLDECERALRHAIIASNRSARVVYSTKHAERAKAITDLPAALRYDSLSSDYQCLLEVLHCADILATCSIRRAQLIRRACLLGIEAAEKGAIEKHLRDAERIAQAGLLLAEEVQNRKALPSRGDYELQWCRSRLLMSAARASVRDPERKRDSAHAMSLLGNAASCLSSTTPQRSDADVAIIELLRAEIRLQEAGRIASGLPEPYSTWEGAVHDMVTGPNPSRWEGRWTPENLQEVKARTVDAMRFLDRALPSLHGKRRSLFWTTWYFDRKLTAIGYLMWISVVESLISNGGSFQSALWSVDRDLMNLAKQIEKGSANDSNSDNKRTLSLAQAGRTEVNSLLASAQQIASTRPIPYCGPQDVVDSYDSEPESILNEATRMIRTDPYRYALILFAFVSCYKAFCVRLADPAFHDWKDLHDRKASMREAIKRGMDSLRDIDERRTKIVIGMTEGKMDDLAEKIVSQVKCIIKELDGVASPR